MSKRPPKINTDKYPRALALLKLWWSYKKTGHIIIHFNQGGVTKIEKYETDQGGE